MKDGDISFFSKQITDAIEYNRRENNVSYLEVIGCLEIIKLKMFREMEDMQEKINIGKDIQKFKDYNKKFMNGDNIYKIGDDS